MKKIKKIKSRFAFLLVACLFVLSTPSIKASTNEVVMKLPINQNMILESAETSVNDEFTYRLVALSDDCPMPQESVNGSYIFHLKGNQNTQLADINFTNKGVYQYQIYQVVDQKKVGYTYDATVYNVIVHISYDSNGNLNSELVVARNDGVKVSDVSFTNTYKVKAAASTGNDNSNPSTGDNTNQMWWMSTSIISFSVVALLLAMKTYKKSN